MTKKVWDKSLLNYGSTIIERKAGFNHEFYEKDKVNYYAGNITVEENINGIKEIMSIVHESSYENLVQTKIRSCAGSFFVCFMLFIPPK